MRRSWLAAVGVGLLFIAQVVPAMSSSPELPTATHVPGELLVGFDRATDERSRASVHRRYGSQVIRHFDEIGVDQVRLPRGIEVGKAQVAYERDRAVRFAEVPADLRLASGGTSV